MFRLEAREVCWSVLRRGEVAGDLVAFKRTRLGAAFMSPQDGLVNRASTIRRSVGSRAVGIASGCISSLKTLGIVVSIATAFAAIEVSAIFA